MLFLLSSCCRTLCLLITCLCRHIVVAAAAAAAATAAPTAAPTATPPLPPPLPPPTAAAAAAVAAFAAIVVPVAAAVAVVVAAVFNTCRIINRKQSRQLITEVLYLGLGDRKHSKIKG